MSAGHFKFCPKCGERLSYTSYEGYCAYTNCLWNNDGSADSVDEAPESTPATPAASSAGLVAHAKGEQGCPRFATLRELRLEAVRRVKAERAKKYPYAVVSPRRSMFLRFFSRAWAVNHARRVGGQFLDLRGAA